MRVASLDLPDLPHWRQARCRFLWLAQGGYCFHCGRAMADPAVQRPRHRKRQDAATIDHVLPRTLGGPCDWRNEVAACRACNGVKADRPPRWDELWRLAWVKAAFFHPEQWQPGTLPDPAAILTLLTIAPDPGFAA